MICQITNKADDIILNALQSSRYESFVILNVILVKEMMKYVAGAAGMVRTVNDLSLPQNGRTMASATLLTVIRVVCCGQQKRV